jgi:hypothetical protein
VNPGAQMSAADLIKRLNFLVADGNLDLEDIETALRAVDHDGLQDDEAEALRDAISDFADRMEPAVLKYLAERLGGRPVQLVPRVLLGPVPRGERPDRFQPRHEVMRLQEALSALGRPLKADGDYGPATTAAVQAFQAEGGLSATGWVDSPTLLALNAALGAAGRPLLDLTPRARIRPDRVLAMKNGANAADNTAVQTALSALAAHYGEPALQLTADGQFGPRTEAAVKALQRRWLLPETGIVDDTTLAAINLALEIAGQPAIALVGGVGLGKVELHFFPGSHEDTDRRSLRSLEGASPFNPCFGRSGSIGRSYGSTSPFNPFSGRLQTSGRQQKLDRVAALTDCRSLRSLEGASPFNPCLKPDGVAGTPVQGSPS